MTRKRAKTRTRGQRAAIAERARNGRCAAFRRNARHYESTTYAMRLSISEEILPYHLRREALERKEHFERLIAWEKAYRERRYSR